MCEEKQAYGKSWVWTFFVTDWVDAFGGSTTVKKNGEKSKTQS